MNSLNQGEKQVPIDAEPNAVLRDEEIMQADNRFLFGEDLLYVVMDREQKVHKLYCGTKEWGFREYFSFWHSWDCDPYLFNPLTGEEAVKLVHEWFSEE